MQLQRLGPYKIVRQIGKGGMGAVYEGVNDRPGPQQGMRVAIKALSPQMAAAEGFRERFESEIVSMMQLSHEGIVQIFGKGEQDGVLFYSMELVEGTSLEEEINAGRRFTWRETLRVGIQVCRALKHAHDVGVVHRDIKPANLLLTSKGRVKIADFGIARFFHNTQLTTAGGVLGTADYMSPEQADGRQVTEKCDQYSLGGVMYALLAGRPPFQAKTMPEMLQLQRFAEPEPVTRYAKDTPDQLNKLIEQLLAKEPNERFPNVMVLGRHMEAMEKALSRETQQSATGTEASETAKRTTPKNHGATAEVGDQQTRAMQQADPFNEETRSGPYPTDISDAATLDIPADYEQSESAADASLGHEPLRSTFTTIDEEKRRQREVASGPNWYLYAQFLLLVFTLTAIVWGGWRLMRPYSADELYEAIVTSVDRDGTDDLRGLKSELQEFADRFESDPRNEELDRYRQMLEVQRFERQARAKARFNGGEANSAIGKVYLEATRNSDRSPAATLRQLQAIVDLYDPAGALKLDPQAKVPGVNETERRWLSLAYQKMDEITLELAEAAKGLLPALQERLKAAAAWEESQPPKAAKIYSALVRLYADQPWAAEVVKSAQTGLKRIAEKKSLTE